MRQVNITFQLEAAEYLALGRHVSRTLLERLIAILCWIGVGAVGVVLGLALHRLVWVAVLGFEWDSLDQRIFVIGSIVSIGVLFFEVVMKTYTRDFVCASQHIGEATLTADASGFSERCGALTVSAPWSAVVRVHKTPKHLLFFTMRRQAIIVPRSADNQEAEDALVAWAEAAGSQSS